MVKLRFATEWSTSGSRIVLDPGGEGQPKGLKYISIFWGASPRSPTIRD
jgi:hypothetical protein